MLQEKLHQRKNQNIGEKTNTKDQIDIHAIKHTIGNSDLGLAKRGNTP